MVTEPQPLPAEGLNAAELSTVIRLFGDTRDYKDPAESPFARAVDASKLNAEELQRLKADLAKGHFTQEGIEVYGKAFAEGDEVIKMAQEAGVPQVGTITAVDNKLTPERKRQVIAEIERMTKDPDIMERFLNNPRHDNPIADKLNALGQPGREMLEEMIKFSDQLKAKGAGELQEKLAPKQQALEIIGEKLSAIQQSLPALESRVGGALKKLWTATGVVGALGAAAGFYAARNAGNAWRAVGTFAAAAVAGVAAYFGGKAVFLKPLHKELDKVKASLSPLKEGYVNLRQEINAEVDRFAVEVEAEFRKTHPDAYKIFAHPLEEPSPAGRATAKLGGRESIADRAAKNPPALKTEQVAESTTASGRQL